MPQVLTLVLSEIPTPLDDKVLQHAAASGQISGRPVSVRSTMLRSGNSVDLAAEIAHVSSEFQLGQFNDLHAVLTVPLWAYRGIEHQKVSLAAASGVDKTTLFARLIETLSSQIVNFASTFRSAFGASKAQAETNGPQPNQSGEAAPGTAAS